MAAGACGYLSKTRAADALVDVVRRAASGEIVMSDDELPIVLDELRTG
jgi:DNA-binding NarL/FixJ family response regulator